MVWEEEYQFVVLIALASAGMLCGYLVLQVGERLMRRHFSSKNRSFGGGWENAARNAVEEAATGGAVGYAAFVQQIDAIRVRPSASGLTVTWQRSGDARAFFEVVHEDEASALFELLREIYWSEQSRDSVPKATLWETSSKRPLLRLGDAESQEVCLYPLKGGFRVEETLHGVIRGAAVLGDQARGERLCELLVGCQVPEVELEEKPKRGLLRKKPRVERLSSSPYKRQGHGPKVPEQGAEIDEAAGGSLDEARRVARESVPAYQPDARLAEHRDHGFDKLFR